MSVLVSKCKDSYKKFSKELFMEVSQNLKLLPDEEWEKNVDLNKSVLFAVYVRTDRDNLVLMADDNQFARISHAPDFMLQGGLYPNFLVDAGLMCGKSLLDSAFTVKGNDALYRIVKNSTCFPVGAVETSKRYIVVFNVVISSDLLGDSEISLKQGYYFKPIETLKVLDSLQQEISESLIIIRK